MKFNNIFIICILLLAILTLGSASASDVNITQEISVSDSEIDDSTQASVESITDDVAASQDDEIISESFYDAIGEFSNETVLSKQVDNDESQIDGEKLQEDSNSKDVVLGSSPKVFINIPKKFVLGLHSVSVDLPVGAKGMVTIYADGKVFEKIPAKNFVRDWDFTYDYETGDEHWFEVQCSASSKLVGLSAGKHTIKVVFSGDPKYGTLSKQVTINAIYLFSVEVNGPYIYGQGVNKDGSKIIINLPRDIKRNPVIVIDGKIYKGAKKYYDYIFYDIYMGAEVKRFVLDVSKLSAGTHTLKVIYNEGSKYPLKSITKKFKVEYSILPIFNSNKYSWQKNRAKYGDGSKFSLKLPSNAKGKLSVYISKKKGDAGKLYKSTSLKKGSASISLDGLKIGKYYAHVVYTGKDYKIKSLDCNVEMDINIIGPKSMGYGQNRYLIIKSHKSDNRQFKVIINNVNYGKIKLVNGVGKLSLKKLPISNHVELSIYDYDDGSYVGDSIWIKVLPLVGGKNINMYYGGGNRYSVKVYNDNGKLAGKGKVVTFKIAGKSYKIKTNAKSIASLKITEKPGKYKIVANYNNRYVVSHKVVVKHILALKTVKVKKSSNKLVLTATLKKAKKAIASKKIIFLFNGKKYVSKTNKYGVAKVLIKKSELNKLKVGKYARYQAIFGKDTIKKFAKVQK